MTRSDIIQLACLVTPRLKMTITPPGGPLLCDQCQNLSPGSSSSSPHRNFASPACLSTLIQHGPSRAFDLGSECRARRSQKARLKIRHQQNAHSPSSFPTRNVSAMGRSWSAGCQAGKQGPLGKRARDRSARLL